MVAAGRQRSGIAEELAWEALCLADHPGEAVKERSLRCAGAFCTLTHPLPLLSPTHSLSHLPACTPSRPPHHLPVQHLQVSDLCAHSGLGEGPAWMGRWPHTQTPTQPASSSPPDHSQPLPPSHLCLGHSLFGNTCPCIGGGRGVLQCQGQQGKCLSSATVPEGGP